MLDKTTKKEYDNTLKGIDNMCDLANKLHKENEQLKSENLALRKYLKENYISSVCDTCEHFMDTRSNNYFGVDYDMECKKGHEDMDISDCADYELTSEVFK